jgi:hypothetical protein
MSIDLSLTGSEEGLPKTEKQDGYHDEAVDAAVRLAKARLAEPWPNIGETLAKPLADVSDSRHRTIRVVTNEPKCHPATAKWISRETTRIISNANQRSRRIAGLQGSVWATGGGTAN